MLLSYRDSDVSHLVNRICYWLLLTAIAGLTSLGGEAAFAAWEVKPIVTVGADMQTNPRHRSDSGSEESATGLRIATSLPTTVRSERTNLTITPTYVTSFYRKEINEDLEDDDKLLTANISHIAPQSGYGMSAGYTKLSLRTSEFEFSDPDSPTGGTGRISAEGTQDHWWVAPYWSYQLSPRNSISLNGGYHDITYNETQIGFFDSDFNSLSASVRHIFDAKNSLSFQANLSNFNSNNPDTGARNESETNGLSVVYGRALSNTLSTNVNLGWARTKSEFSFSLTPIEIPGLGPVCPGTFAPPPCDLVSKSDVTNFVGDISLTLAAETTQYTVSVGQSVSPNSAGSEVLRQTAQGFMTKTFTERLSGSLGVLAFDQKNVGESTLQERQFVSLTTSLNWKFSERWSVSGHYTYTYDRAKGLVFDRQSTVNHRLFLSVIWAGLGWR